MKKSWLFGLVVGASLGIAGFVLWISGGDVHIKTPANVVKFDGTEISNPSNVQAVNATPPAVQFQWVPPNGSSSSYHTRNQNAATGAAGGDLLEGRPLYLFSIKGDELRVCRNTGLWDWLVTKKPVPLIGSGATHTPVSMDGFESFDLRDEFSGQGDHVIIAVQSTTEDDKEPKKRLYSISIEEIEDKLP